MKNALLKLLSMSLSVFLYPLSFMQNMAEYEKTNG